MLVAFVYNRKEQCIVNVFINLDLNHQSSVTRFLKKLVCLPLQY